MTKPNNIPVVDSELISVIDVINRNVINRNEDFDYLVPAYQRCYRWTEDNVNDFLKDFVDFFDRYHEDKEQKYCLQPLTLKKVGNCHKIIIDGQQRLTTLYILLAYLNRECTLEQGSILSKEKHSIVYEGRSKTEKYLRDLCDMSNTTEMIIKKYNRDGGTWTRDIDCMANAYGVINEFFTEHVDASDKIISLLTNGRICFIRQTYQENSDTEIKLFNGINVGRTELTDAELIRAKLILSTGDNSEEATSKAKEWDEIEHCLQNNKMWYFLTDEKNNDASRILFIFNVIRDSSGIEWDTQKKHSTYRFFQEYALGKDGKFVKGNTFEKNNLEVFWKRSKELYKIFCKWYSDVEIYNYLGLLLTDKSEKSPSANNLVDKYLEVNTRSEFIAYLKSEILYSFDDRDITYIWPYEEKQTDANKRLVNALFSMPESIDYEKKAYLDQLRKHDMTADKKKEIKIRTIDNDDKTVVSDVEVNVTLDGQYVTTGKTDEHGTFTMPVNGNGKYSISVNNVENYSIDSADKTKEVEINKDNKSGDIVFEFTEKIEDYNKNSVFRTLSYSGRRTEKKFDEYDHRERCHHFLLWSNCELLITQMKNCMVEDKDVVFDMYRFPFDSYKTDHPDVEHVDSFVDMRDESKFFKDEEEQRFWLECVIPLIENKKTIKEIIDLWEDEKNRKISTILEKVNNCFDDSNLDKTNGVVTNESDLFDKFEDRRKIGNLTLLDKNINRGYKNFPFIIKRQDIINKGLGGIYVYPCTKMVFLKEFDPNTADLMSWNSNDYYNYWRFLLNLFINCFCSDKNRKYNTEILAKTVELIEKRGNK